MTSFAHRQRPATGEGSSLKPGLARTYSGCKTKLGNQSQSTQAQRSPQNILKCQHMTKRPVQSLDRETTKSVRRWASPHRLGGGLAALKRRVAGGRRLRMGRLLPPRPRPPPRRRRPHRKHCRTFCEMFAGFRE